MRLSFAQQKHRGFTLSELLVVTLVIALILLVVLFNYQKQIQRANDAKRKADLNKMQQAFEDYYNDHACYPDQDTMSTQANCGTAVLAPYIQTFPCDPTTHEPYLYAPSADLSGGVCGGYRLLAALQDWSDPDIARSGCSTSPLLGCGFSPPKYNYGIAMNTSIARPGLDLTAIPSPTPTGPPGGAAAPWACNTEGTCNNFGAAAFEGSPSRCVKGFVSDSVCASSGCPVNIRCNW